MERWRKCANVTEGSFWLDWFFAHEAAHLFQQDKVEQARRRRCRRLDSTRAGGCASGAHAGSPRAGGTYIAISTARGGAAILPGAGDLAARPGGGQRQFRSSLPMRHSDLVGDRRAAARVTTGSMRSTRFFASVKAGTPWDGSQASWPPRTVACRRTAGLIGAVAQGYTDPDADVAALHSARKRRASA
jgi:hypothetical protein